MTIKKLRSGRFQAILKSGRSYVSARTFATRGEAINWLARERAAMAGGVDPRAARATVRSLLPLWLEERRHSVTKKTYVADQALNRLTPPFLSAMSIGSVTDREVTRVLVQLARDGFAEASVRRFRASLSSFFAWAVRERLILDNPVLRTRVPRVGQPRQEMYPFGEQELEEVYGSAVQLNQRFADLMLVAGWTGLRWSELRAVRVRDFVEVPLPLIVVERAEPESAPIKGTKSGRARRVPLSDRILPIVKDLAADRAGDDWLFVTEGGHRLYATSFKRLLRWELTGRGRRIHDLRHTAACLWLARGVDPATVQAWMGHASIATTNIYLHHLGTAADQAGLERLNGRRGQSGGNDSAQGAEGR